MKKDVLIKILRDYIKRYQQGEETDYALCIDDKMEYVKLEISTIPLKRSNPIQREPPK